MTNARVVLALLAMTLGLTSASPTFGAETVKRSCFGLLWCTEERDGAVSTDGLFYLYSSERKGDASRLAVRPFYSMEDDPGRRYLRRSILWPLGTYERTGDDLSFHIFPLFWQGREPTLRYTLAIPIYFDYATPAKSYVFFGPLYGHERRGETFDRYFVLGPSLIITRDTSRDLFQWDALAFLAHHRSERGRGSTWVLPVYWSAYDTAAGRSFRYLFPLFGDWQSPALHHRFVFPLYGSAASAGDRRLSLIGLPPIPAIDPLPTLALYEHRTTRDRITDRLFPIYRYASRFDGTRTDIDVLLLYRHSALPDAVTDRLFPLYRYDRSVRDQRLQFSVLGHREFAIGTYARDASGSRTHVFPLFSADRNADGSHRAVGLIGYGPFSLYRHRTTPTSVADRLFPLYDWESTPGRRALSVAGVSEAALFRLVTTPTRSTHRLFPIYSVRTDTGSHSNDVSALLLYHHHADPTVTSDRLFPLYGYRASAEGTYVSALGFPPLGNGFAPALYAHASTPRRVTDRFFPLYRFARDRDSGEVRWDALFVYQHRRTPTYTKDGLLPLYRYERDATAETFRFSAVGIPPLTLFDQRSTPAERSGRLVPLYGYRRTGAETRLSALGLPPLGDAPALALYEHRARPDRVSDRVFPLYRFASNRGAETSLNILLLYHHRTDAAGVDDALFPLYSVERTGNTLAVSAFGYRGFSLARYKTSPSALHHRFLPVYVFSHNRTADESFLHVLLLYSHARSREGTRDGLFPLYHVTQHPKRSEWAFSALGLEPILPVALIAHRGAPGASAGRFFPVYDYERHGDNRTLSVLGISEFALYRHEATPTITRDRLFPLYRYSVDTQTQERRFAALLLLHVTTTPTRTSTNLFPLYSYSHDRRTTVRRVGVLGFAPLSLYQHLSTPDHTTDRVFPLYSYAYDRHSAEGRFSLLWPLVTYKNRAGRTTEASLLWWLIAYERPDDTHREFRILGGDTMALFRRDVTPERSVIEFNPILPLYYRRTEAAGTTWNIFGGLVGREVAADGRGRMRWLWVL